MAPVFGHGRLRLYLLRLLDESPRHGYEVIRLLEERFQGLYAPSAGTVYPRLAKLEQEGLVSHANDGGRKVYSITDAGRAELASRSEELAELEAEIRESVAALAAEIRDDVRGSARDLRKEVLEAARQTRRRPYGEREPWDTWGPAERRRAKQEWREQLRQAREEMRQAKEEARQARHQARHLKDQARGEMLDAARRVQEEVRHHFAHGDWPSGLVEGINQLTKELASLGDPARYEWTAPVEDATVPAAADAAGQPDWAADEDASPDPVRDLERLLDRFRDDVRDAARDNGVTAEQLRAARRCLVTAAARIRGLLHD